MLSQAVVLDAKEVRKRRYEEQKILLEENIEALFAKYRGKLSGKNGEALVKLRKTSRDMISDVDFVYFPCSLIATMLESEEQNNYYYVNQIYANANDLMMLLLADTLDNEAINAAKNTLKNNIDAFLPERETLDCCTHSMSAFYNALIVAAAIFMICLIPFAPIGVAIGLGVAGLFVGAVGVARLTYSAKIINDSARKESLEFANLADEVVNAITPGKSL